MPIPTITTIEPAALPTSGGELVRIRGTGFAENLLVIFGGVNAKLIAVRPDGTDTIADVTAPAHDAGAVSVEVHNLDTEGLPVTGESAVRPLAFTYRRPDLTRESDVARVVRKVLRDLKQQILKNTSISVSVDYDYEATDLEEVVHAQLPSIVIQGPTIRENRFYSSNETREFVVMVDGEPEIQRMRPARTVDLQFTLSCASALMVELLNLQSEVSKFFNRNVTLEMLRDEANPALGSVEWEMSPTAEIRTSYRSDPKADGRAFTMGFEVRGFDIDEGASRDRGRAVEEVEVESEQQDE